MNVHVRFCAVAAFAAMTAGVTPLAAQSAARDSTPAFAGMGIVPGTLVDSITAVAANEANASGDASVVTTAAPRGPSLASARVASHSVSTAPVAPPVIQNRTSNRHAVALMIVGGTALVVGAVIGNGGGTLVMVAGAAIGLYGLYQFLT